MGNVCLPPHIVHPTLWRASVSLNVGYGAKFVLLSIEPICMVGKRGLLGNTVGVLWFPLDQHLYWNCEGSIRQCAILYTSDIRNLTGTIWPWGPLPVVQTRAHCDQ